MNPKPKPAREEKHLKEYQWLGFRFPDVETENAGIDHRGNVRNVFWEERRFSTKRDLEIQIAHGIPDKEVGETA